MLISDIKKDEKLITLMQLEERPPKIEYVSENFHHTTLQDDSLEEINNIGNNVLPS